MKTFCLALIAMTLFTSALAFNKQEVDGYAQMGLMMAQGQLGLSPECTADLGEAWGLVTKVYEAFSEGKTSDLFTIIIQAAPLWNKIQADCLN